MTDERTQTRFDSKNYTHLPHEDSLGLLQKMTQRLLLEGRLKLGSFWQKTQAANLLIDTL
jgi:hypothetical protein